MNDKELQQVLKREQAAAEAGPVPAFERVWSGAGRQVASQRRRRLAAGSLAAAIAITVVAAGLLQSRQPAWEYVDPEDFVTGTSWQAPSDILLPEYRIDIYEEIPVLIESTEFDEGALL